MTNALSNWSIAESIEGLESCALPDLWSSEVTGEPLILVDSEEYCDLVAVPVAVLRGSTDSSVEGSVPEPGARIVMTSDGRYLTNSAYGHQILEWSADGEFLRAVGSPGEGPGEFSPRGPVMLFLGPADSLFVLDGGSRWTVFDPHLEYRRTFTGQFNGRQSSALHLVMGRGILTTAYGLRGGDPDLPFHWTDFEGNPVASFGSQMGDPSRRSGEGARVSGLDGADGLWVTPPNGTAEGMTLERWSFDGEHLATLERHVPWLPREGYPPAEYQPEPAMPEYERVQLDSGGLLWVTVVVRDPRWRSLPREERGPVEMELYDARMEVIDPASGIVLVSYRYDGPDEELPPFAGFLGGRRSYREVRDPVGGRSIELFDIHLVQK